MPIRGSLTLSDVAARTDVLAGGRMQQVREGRAVSAERHGRIEVVPKTGQGAKLGPRRCA
jgi:hypothetical protein